jgi:hypothetical protein
MRIVPHPGAEERAADHQARVMSVTLELVTSVT